MHETDAPEFNKARGYLIGFSVLLTLLWFFGADLTRFKLLGNEIDFHQNVEHVWLVMAIVNIYLWLRFLQRLPDRGLHFDEQMHAIFDYYIIRNCRRSCHRRAFREIAAEIASEEAIKPSNTSSILLELKMQGRMCYVVESEVNGLTDYDQIKPWEISFPDRGKVTFTLTKTTTSGIIEGGNSYEAELSRLAYLITLIESSIRGALGHTWYTDNLFPISLGMFSTGLALQKWYLINWPL